MSKFKVLVTDYYFATLKHEREILAEVDAELYEADCRTEEEVIKAVEDVGGVDGLLVENALIGRKVFEALPRLKVVGRYGIGVDVVDLEAATEHGVYVVNVSSYCEDEVSNHALALLLACIRKITQLNDTVRKGNWDYNPFKPIYRTKGKVLGIIGFGKIPRVLVKKVKPFGFKIIVYDPFIDKSVEKEYGIKIVDLDDLIKNADYISVHVPLTESTKHMISTREFNMMKDTAFIINTSRGPLLDEKALIKALENKKIAGAAMDVIENEPITKDNPLIKMPNVIITPHVAYYSEESLVELQSKVARGVADALVGKVPENLVNRDVLRK